MTLKVTILVWFVLLNVLENLTVVSQAVNTTVHVFLDDDQLWLNAIAAPTDLGSFPYECVGNIDLCPGGFTISVWHKPDPGDSSLPYRYVLSTGGQSAISDGVYVRQNYGEEYEVGVADGTILWSVKFYLLPGYWTNIALTWSLANGLNAYVDGEPAGSDSTGHGRVFWGPDFDPFPDLVLGAANDGNLETQIGSIFVYRMIHVDAEYDQEDVASFVSNITNSLLLTCSSTSPTFLLSPTGVVNDNDPATMTDVQSCRKSCVADKLNLALFQSSANCACVNATFYFGWLLATGNAGWDDPTCTGTERYLLEWATHVAFDPQFPIDLAVKVVDPTSKPYVRPNETVTFQLSQNATGSVTFYLDFDDGVALETNDPVVGHSWTSEGKYLVNVTAATRTTVETVVTEVDVEFVAEGVAPQNLVVDAAPNATATATGYVDIFLTVYSPDSTSCSVAYGDGKVKVFPSVADDFVFQESETHVYPSVGLYGIAVNCTNDFGSSVTSQLASAVNPTLLYENVNFPGDVVNIPFSSTDVAEVVGVSVDGVNQQTGVTSTSQTVSIDGNVFASSGEHVVALASPSGVSLYQEVFNLESPVVGLTVSTSVAATQVNENVNVTVVVNGGQNLHVNISFGDGATNLLYFPLPTLPLTIVQSHSYSALGRYEVAVAVANDVSQANATATVSVESPIVGADMTATNVTALDANVTFALDVKIKTSSAMPLTVDFDYGNGVAETVTLLPQTSTVVGVVAVATHNYAYGKYGIYRVNATVRNEISRVALPVVVVQVGENITLVDLYVDDAGVVAAGGNVVVTAFCPTGSPVVLRMDFGDGSVPVVMTRPTDYQPTDDFAPSKSMSSSSPSSSYSLNVNGYFVVTYNYQNAGKYSVSATVANTFSDTSTRLCPDVVVVSSNAPVPQCNGLVVSIAPSSAATAKSPIVNARSTPLTVATSTTLRCSGPATSKFVPGYTWTTERFMSDGSWRPELAVCVSNVANDALTVPNNTLWYDTYRFNVTLVVGVGSAPTVVVSGPASTYVTVTPSDLVASIANTDENQFSLTDVIVVDMSQSNDPDVDPANKTGMSFLLFCYTESTTVLTGLSLSQMVARATVVVGNADGDAHLYQFAVDPCFPTFDPTSIEVNDFEVDIHASAVTTKEPVNLALYVTKDERIATTTYQIQVWSTNVTGSALGSIDSLLKSGNTNAALLVINMVTSTLGGQDNNVQQKTDLRGQLINALDKVSDNLQNMNQLQKTAVIMNSVTANPDEVTQDAKVSASNAMSKTASCATNFSSQASSDVVANVTGTMLSSVGNILPFASPSTVNGTNASSDATASPSSRRRRRRSILTTLKSKLLKHSGADDNSTNVTTGCCDQLDGLCDWIEPVSCVDELDRKKTNWTDADCGLQYPDDIAEIMARYIVWMDEQQAAEDAVKKTITTNGMGACGSLGGVLVSKQGDGNNVSVSSAKMNLTVTKLAPNQGSAQSSDFTIPGASGGCGAMTMKSPNPYTYSSTANQITGNVLTLSLTTCDGQTINVENSEQPIVIWIDGSPVEPEFLNFTIQSNVMNYHRMNITDNNTAIFLVLQPTEPYENYTVYLKYQDFPNETYYDWVGEVPHPVDPGMDPTEYGYIMFPPQNLTQWSGVYRFGLMLNVDPSEADEPPTNYTYGLYMFATACRFWNETLDAWDTSGCAVGPLTTPMKTQCVCNHLTSFGSSFVVPANTIDFNTVFTLANFLQSIPVFTTVIAIIVAYLVVLVWARRMDKRDIARWGAVPLEDNLPSDSYYYQVAVYTGMRKDAGTSSKPSFVLSGDYADSGIRRLADGKRKHFGAGSIHNYILSVDGCLGPLTFLRVWHDNEGVGKRKGWFLDQIQITDLQTGEKFFFVCDRWLAVEEDNGAIERVIPVAGTTDLTQFKQMFTQSVRKKFSNDHMWFSIVSRPTRSSFTRVQRISCCVSVLFLTMISNCMFFKATDPDHTTSIHIGPIEITLQQIYISVVCTCIVLPPSIIIVTIFRKVRPKTNAVKQENQSEGKARGGTGVRARLQKLKVSVGKIVSFHQQKKKMKKKYEEGEGEGGEEEGETEEGKKEKKKPMTFPYWTLYIAYGLVFLAIFVSGFFTILYSMQWGRQKSMDWLTTFFLSFFQSVIVVQPVKVLALAAFLSCILKKPDVQDEEEPELNAIKPDEEYINNSHLDLQEIIKMRQSSRAGTGLPDMEALRKSRENRLKEMQIEGVLKECLVYLCFIFVVYFISYQDQDRRSFLFSQNLQNTFFEGDPKFAQIKTYNDVYAWINQTMIPNLYTNGWYNGQAPQNWMELLEIDDHVTVRLGVARLRQLRTKNNSCTVEKIFRNLIKHCRSDYNWVDDDTASYDPGWAPLHSENASAACPLLNDTNDPWTYRDAIDLKGAPYAGKVNTYKGGGYTFNFYRQPAKTLEKLGELESQGWLDVRTRGLFVELTVYNGNVNLYGTVIMLIEFLANGGTVPNVEVKVFRLTSYVGAFGVIVILFQVIFVAFIVYFAYRTVKLVRKDKLEYFKDFWNLLELTTMIMSIVTVGMYAMKMIFGNMAMDILNDAGSGEYVNFVAVAIWAETYMIILSVVVFLATIKFINMLKFNRRLTMLQGSLKAAAQDVRAYVITFFLYFFAFSQLGYLIFSTQLSDYATFADTVEMLFCLVRRQAGFDELQTAQPMLGPAFYFFFTWFVVFGLQTMFFCIVCEAFRKVRKDAEYQRNEYEVGDYVLTRVKAMFGIR